MTEEPYDAIRELLPPRGFSIGFRRLDTRIVIVALCHCGRKLDMLDSLPSNLLLRWLIDHNDEMFLTDAERDAKYEATIYSVTEHGPLSPLTGPFGPFDPDGPFLQPPDGLRAELARGALPSSIEGIGTGEHKDGTE